MAGSFAQGIPPFPTPPPPPERPLPAGSPVGARWVAGLGAFLLVAAAATFVAVRWDDIPDSAKLAALVAVTCGCIAAHRRLQASLPVTAAALFHLGVLLVPIDVAAAGLRAGWTWPGMLLAQGLTATVVFGVAAQIERSVVLRVAAWAGVVALAGGIGGSTALPAGLVLATVAAVAVTVAGRRSRGWSSFPDLDLAAAGWATLASLAVPLAGAERLGWPAAGVLVDLGLAGEPPHPLAAATGLVSGLALGLVAHRHRSLPAGLLGVGCALVGATTAFVSLRPSGVESLAAVATLCLLAEAGAWARRNDPFWAQPTEIVANLAEGVAGVFAVGLAGVVFLAPFYPSPEPVAGLAAGLVAISWIVAFVRRPVGWGRALWSWAPFAAAVAASAAVTLWTGSGGATAVALTFFGTAVVFGPAAGTSIGPPTGRVLAAGLLGWAPLAGYDSPALASVLALVGAVVLAEAAVRVARSGDPRHTTAPALLLTMTSLAPLAAGALVLAAHGQDGAAAVGATAGAWLVAVVLDRTGGLTPFGVGELAAPFSLIPRVAALLPLAVAPALEPNHAAVLGGLVAGLALLDALRLDEPLLVVGAGIGTPVAVVGLAVASGATVPEAGLGVTLSGVAWLGVSGSLPRRWVPPAVISAGIAAAVGLALSLADPAVASTGLLVIGVALAGVGATVGRSELMVSGLAVGTVGVWGHLVLADVTITEPYLAPVAALLLAAGAYAHHQTPGGVSSWVAYAPAVGLLGGAGLLERLNGGPAWHTLVAGTVGTLAVAAGGAWRLAGPLLIGTALVVAVTIHETLGVTTSLPTPVWLATGGALLLAAGVAMERRGTGPYETGRRLVDLVRERFV